MAANYVLLEKITVGAAGAASITFNNIPQTGYTDLKIVYSARGLAASTDRGMFVQFNGDTTSSYTYKFLRGDGSSAGSGGSTTTFLYWGNFPAASSTANTFGNGEFYIPNYTSSNYKSVSSDSVSENNATAGWDTFVAGLWSKTNAITSILLYPESGNFAQYSTFSLYGLAAVGATPVIDPKATGGDIIQTDGTYWYHAFLSSGTFTPKVGLTCDVLVVAGGGGGAASGAGGGGLLAYTSQNISASAQTITVGAGGAGGANGQLNNGSNGGNSSFGSLTAAVGGGGSISTTGATNSLAGISGGSGSGAFSGGAGSDSGSRTGGAGTSGQGNAGGNSYYGSGSSSSGGGGGAGAVGSSATTTNMGGAGGVGATSSLINAIGAATGLGQLSGGNYYFAGGGGGGYYVNGAAVTGGTGGGGTGSSNNAAGSSGTPNTGGGAGGYYSETYKTSVYNGGSGLVIVRYAI